MKQKKPLTPFPITGYFGPEYYCNRMNETNKLLSSCKSGINTTLFSIRRVGKTGLINHVFHFIKKDIGFITLYLDILSTTNLKEFIDVFYTNAINSCPETTSFGRKLLKMIKTLRPLISYEPHSGEPQVTFQYANESQKENNLRSIFKIINDQDKNVVIAIDEFQQISEYPEKNVESLLRSEIQRLKNVSFIFSGSQQHLLTNMFASAKRPFFSSTQMMKLEKLPEDEYCNFIIHQFKKINSSITRNDVLNILEWTKCHTFYTQFVCHRLCITCKSTINSHEISDIKFQILKENESIYYSYRNLLTEPQWHLLGAIAKEQKVLQPMSSVFIERYHLGSPATVRRSIQSLMQKEMIYQETDGFGNVCYEVYDVFFSRWLEQTINGK